MDGDPLHYGHRGDSGFGGGMIFRQLAEASAASRRCRRTSRPAPECPRPRDRAARLRRRARWARDRLFGTGSSGPARRRSRAPAGRPLTGRRVDLGGLLGLEPFSVAPCGWSGSVQDSDSQLCRAGRVRHGPRRVMTAHGFTVRAAVRRVGADAVAVRPRARPHCGRTRSFVPWTGTGHPLPQKRRQRRGRPRRTLDATRPRTPRHPGGVTFAAPARGTGQAGYPQVA